jgi:hypothetical protein
MRTKILSALVAGGLLVGAGILTTAISSPGTAQAQEESDDVEERGPIPRILGFLGDVLDDLVGEGTITQDQADAIVDAAEEKATELKEERMALHEQLAGMLEDGVLSEDEAAELPDDHWLLGNALEEAWKDGQLTAEEIREVRPHRHGNPFKRGLRLGALLDDGGLDQEEYDRLPDDHPLKRADLSEYLEDGLITPEELHETFEGHVESRFGDDA